jgi:hypothetical protein
MLTTSLEAGSRTGWKPAASLLFALFHCPMFSGHRFLRSKGFFCHAWGIEREILSGSRVGGSKLHSTVVTIITPRKANVSLLEICVALYVYSSCWEREAKNAKRILSRNEIAQTCTLNEVGSSLGSMIGRKLSFRAAGHFDMRSKSEHVRLLRDLFSGVYPADITF